MVSFSTLQANATKHGHKSTIELWIVVNRKKCKRVLNSKPIMRRSYILSFIYKRSFLACQTFQISNFMSEYTQQTSQNAHTRSYKATYYDNKANLRDLTAATSLVISLKLDPNRQFFSPCDFEIWWMTPKNNRAHHLYYMKLCASFQIHHWLQTGVTVRKRPIWVKIDDYFSCVALQYDVWPWKTIGHLLYATSSFVHHFVDFGELKLELQSGNAQSGSNSTIFRAVWHWNLTDDLK